MARRTQTFSKSHASFYSILNNISKRDHYLILTKRVQELYSSKRQPYAMPCAPAFCKRYKLKGNRMGF